MKSLAFGGVSPARLKYRSQIAKLSVANAYGEDFMFGSVVFVLQLKDLPKPSFMGKTIEELAIGTYTKVVSVRPQTLSIFKHLLHLFAHLENC